MPPDPPDAGTVSLCKRLRQQLAEAHDVDRRTQKWWILRRILTDRISSDGHIEGVEKAGARWAIGHLWVFNIYNHKYPTLHSSLCQMVRWDFMSANSRNTENLSKTALFLGDMTHKMVRNEKINLPFPLWLDTNYMLNFACNKIIGADGSYCEN